MHTWEDITTIISTMEKDVVLATCNVCHTPQYNYSYYSTTILSEWATKWVTQLHLQLRPKQSIVVSVHLACFLCRLLLFYMWLLCKSTKINPRGTSNDMEEWTGHYIKFGWWPNEIGRRDLWPDMDLWFVRFSAHMNAPRLCESSKL